MNRSVVKQYIIFIWVGLISLQVSGQDYVLISGKVIDLETKNALSFATINIRNKPVGVVANNQGEFTFTFPKQYITDTIVFSMMGYETEKFLAQSLMGQDELQIELVNKAVILSEVVITDKQLSAWEILSLALTNIKRNYPSEPFEFKAFYRDYKQENGKCISIFEAAIAAYDRGYSKVAHKQSFKEKVVLEQVRKSLSVDYQHHVFKKINVIKELLKLNDVRYQSRTLNKKRRQEFDYELEGYEVINDRLMHKIKAKDDWEYFIYVDIVTYAIPRIEMNFEWVEGVDENIWTLGDTLRYNQKAATFVLDFQLINGLHYPKYSSFTTLTDVFNIATDSLVFTSYLMQEYMVTDIDFTPEEKPVKSERMDPDLAIEQQKFKYDPEFWNNYNIIQLNPLNEALIKGLEEQMTLEDQFSTSGKLRD